MKRIDLTGAIEGQRLGKRRNGCERSAEVASPAASLSVNESCLGLGNGKVTAVDREGNAADEILYF